MANITIPQDCGNSPRQVFLKEFNTAFAKADVEFIIDHVSEDIVWWILGAKNWKERMSNKIICGLYNRKF